MNIEELKFPIGKFKKPEILTAELLSLYINDIKMFPKRIRTETESLSELQLDTPYRPEGWTVRQVVNHCADSHMNSLIRFKLALTEKKPVIKPYDEALWAELADSKTMPIEPALKILEGIHQRWAVLLQSFTEAERDKSFIHPESNSEISLGNAIGTYAWHCNHHLAHITNLKNRENW